MTFRILILGGTTEARQLAKRLSGDARLEVQVSLAGRTAKPIVHAVPLRIGGFGGAAGLADHLRREEIDVLIDATHPFAANISANAVEASAMTGTELIVLRRPPWIAGPGDRWTAHADIPSAINSIGTAPRRVFVTLGRQELEPLTIAPQHHYLIRSVEPVLPSLPIPSADYILDRGPFGVESEKALLEMHKIDVIVSKNSGGAASVAKLMAARSLQIPVVMIERPPAEKIAALQTIDDVTGALNHWLVSQEKRGE